VGTSAAGEAVEAGAPHADTSIAVKRNMVPKMYFFIALSSPEICITEHDKPEGIFFTPFTIL
jgi:hypothetical protein